ncbi:hypothetical protein [Marinicella sp. W31]|uniref:hypothetical protein n=1 Tax=Marinicella sp. W31 TaxID=3023713 RepID=UPI0037580207
MTQQGQLQVIQKFTSGLLLRDNSGRLTFEIFDIPGESYDLKKAELAKAFSLKRWGFTIHGFDESFQTFRKGKQRLSIEWDIWSGLTIIAKDITTESLITEMVNHFEMQAEKNLKNSPPILIQQRYRNQLMQLTQKLTEFEHKNSVSGLTQYIQTWHQAYLKALNSNHNNLKRPVYSDEEILALENMHKSCQSILSNILEKEIVTITSLEQPNVDTFIQQASDAYFLMLKRGRFSECIVCF